jgi:hypothetical protein
VLPGEAQVTQGLAQVQRRLQAATGIAAQNATPASTRPDPLADELAQLRALRAQLQQSANAAQSAGTNPARRATPPAPAGGTGATTADIAAGAVRLAPLLRAQGANAHELAAVERIARTLGQSPPLPTGRAPDVQRLRSEVDLLDALELQLERRAASGQPTRSALAGRGAEQYQSAVAEYYRQLSGQ